MNSKKFVIVLLFSIMSIVLSVIFFNLLIDPIGQFHNIKIKNINANKTSVSYHERIYKFYDLQRNIEKYNSFLFGTSRTDQFDIKDLEKYTQDKTYNISLSASTPNEQIYFLNYILSHQEKVNYIIFSVDFFSYNPASTSWGDFDETRFSGDSYKDIISYTVSLDALKLSYDTLVKNLHHKPSTFTAEGSIHHSTKNSQFDEAKFNTMLKAFKDIPTMYNSKEFQEPHSIDKKLDIFKEMIEMLKERHIKYKVFITPISYEQRQLITEENLEETYQYWKKNLLEVSGEIYDFNYDNKITTNKNNFVDSSHIQPRIAPLIFKQLFEYNPNEKFGIILLNNPQMNSRNPDAI